MIRTRLPILLLLGTGLLLLLPSLGLANGKVWWNRYYQFRHHSGLPGNMHGVTPDGEVHFSGALQQNIPVAYTPSAGNWVVNANVGSNTAKVELQLLGGPVNSGIHIGAGLLQPGRGLYVGWTGTGSDLAEAFSVQYQLCPEQDGRPAVAVGVLDALNERRRYPGEPLSARSFYATATGRLQTDGPGPIYWTVGLGEGRFNSVVFGGLSYPLGDRVRLVAEWDGFGTNLGAAVALRGAKSDQRGDLLGYLGWTNLQRPAVGLTATWR